MRQLFRAIVGLLAASAALVLIARIGRSRCAVPAGVSVVDASVPRVKGHPWLAATYDFLTQRAERRVLGPLRADLLADARGRVLEIGAGTGANLPYYRTAGRIVATEPDPFMLARARKRADRLGLTVEFRQAPAEVLPFADATFDTVVATLVFCSVGDPARGFAEIRRVLDPEGTFRFIEHVRADGGLLERLQDRVTPVWRRCTGGCHLNRRTAASIEAAGLEIVELQHRPLFPTPLIIGVARPRR